MQFRCRLILHDEGMGSCPWICAGLLVECSHGIERPVRCEPMLVSHDKEFLSADSASGNWKEYPASSKRRGSPRTPFKIVVDISPKASLSMKPGVGRKDGRLRTIPNVFENSAFVSGLGAHKLYAPEALDSSMRNRIAPITSAM